MQTYIPSMQRQLQDSLLGVGDYLRLGWQACWAQFANVVLLIAISYLPLILMYMWEPSSLTASDGISAPVVVLRLAALISQGLIFLTVPQIIESAVFDRHFYLNSALLKSMTKILPIYFLGIVASLGIALGFLCLIIPGIWLSVAWSFCFEVAILRDRGLGALAYSQELVRGRWWKVFARGFYLILAFTLLAIVVQEVVLWVNGIFGLIGLGTILSGFIGELCAIYGISVLTVMFLNFDRCLDA